MKNFIFGSFLVVMGFMLVISSQAIATDKTQALMPHPHLYVLEAPKHIDQWEPSAAIVIDFQLWVANDKPLEGDGNTWGVLAAYNLNTIQTWEELRAKCQTEKDRENLMKGKCDGNKPVNLVFVSGAEKIEAGASLKGDGIWWDTKNSNKSVICIGQQQNPCIFNGLTKPSDGDLRKLVAARIKNLDPKELMYVTIEGLAIIDNQNWVGVRKYREKGKKEEVYWTAIVDHKGVLAWGGGNLNLDQKSFTVSDLSADGSDGLWVTLSYEKLGKDNVKREDVDGRLAWIKLNEDGNLDSMHLCMDEADVSKPLVLAGKPEGIAVFGEKLVIVYDNDKDRKEGEPKDGKGFPIRSNQDYLEFIKKPNCSEGPKLDTE